jgi:hypothetical protein
MDQFIVRAGLARPANLIDGTAPHATVPGLTGFSVQSAPGVPVAALAAAGQFRNGQISVTTLREIRRAGFEIVFPTPGRGLYHATVRVPYPLTSAFAVRLSFLFEQCPNPCVCKGY